MTNQKMYNQRKEKQKTFDSNLEKEEKVDGTCYERKRDINDCS